MVPKKKILFVCLGNTCRSPMAESVMRDLVDKFEINWEVDSAGLRSWNVGYYPDDRCLKVLSEYGLNSDHLGRELHEGDYHNYDFIFGMDDSNIEELRDRSPQRSKAKVELLGAYIGPDEEKVISDPYFDYGMTGFRRCFQQIAKSCKNFLEKELRKEVDKHF